MRVPSQRIITNVLTVMTNMTVVEISTASGLSHDLVSEALQRMHRQGRIVRTFEGRVRRSTNSRVMIYRYRLVEINPELARVNACIRQLRKRRERVRAARLAAAKVYRQSDERSTELRDMWAEKSVAEERAA